VIASIAVFWAMAQQIGAFMAGGYVHWRCVVPVGSWVGGEDRRRGCRRCRRHGWYLHL
jgi:hypothetical protein